MKAQQKDFLVTATRVIEEEAQAIQALIPRIDERFLHALDMLASCKGKIVVMGMGKSGIICKKIASTFSSTGSPSFFLHPAEAVHGDLGLLGPEDIVLTISKSGETSEILQVIVVLKRLKLPLVALVGNVNSTIGRHAEVTLDVSVQNEACPLGLAPTTSTTAALAMGDALAMALMEKKGFRREDFASVHPAGAIGKKLLLVGELMHQGDKIPRVDENTPMADVIYEMSHKGLGMTSVTTDDGVLIGLISDGDLRRLLNNTSEPFKLPAGECMTRSPKTIRREELATAALAKMEELKITSLVVVDSNERVVGVVHIHDLWRTQMF